MRNTFTSESNQSNILKKIQSNPYKKPVFKSYENRKDPNYENHQNQSNPFEKSPASKSYVNVLKVTSEAKITKPRNHSGFFLSLNKK